MYHEIQNVEQARSAYMDAVNGISTPATDSTFVYVKARYKRALIALIREALTILNELEQ